MDEEYGGSFITIEDEEGNEFELEQVDSLEYSGEEYSLFLPANMEEDDPDYGYIILRSEYEEDEGEFAYCSVDDEEELVAVYGLFMEKLFDDEDSGEDSDEEEDE